MMRHIIILCIAMTVLHVCTARAQEVRVKGVVTDAETGGLLERATVKLLTADSTYVAGVPTDDRGCFAVAAGKQGVYLLKVSSLGYMDITKRVELVAGKTLSVDTLALSTNVTMLDEAVVTANVPKMTVKEDTIVYNAAAYRVPEGAAIEALIERLPGAKIEDDGTITINGKPVKKFLLDGREFMLGDIESAMKNLPADIVDKVKTYDEKSDLAKLTGIDDGNEQTVLDFTVKKSMKKGFNVNSNIGYGTEERYGGRLVGSRFHGNLRFTLMGNMNNTNNMGFGGGRGRAGGRSGLLVSKMGSLNINYDRRDKLRIDGGLRWNHNDGDNWSRNAVENFVNKTGAFSNSKNQRYSRNDSWNGNMNLRWQPDTLTTINVRPSFSFSTNDGRSIGASASYKEDPYMYVDDPLSTPSIDQMADMQLMVNSRSNKSLSHNRNWAVGNSVQIHRKLNSKGRNVALSAGFNYSRGDAENLSASNVHLFLLKDVNGQDSTYQTNRYNLTPNRNFSYNVGLTYTEPLMKLLFLQTSYSFNYNHSVSDRATYNFGRLGYESLDGVMNEYGDWNSYFDLLERPLQSYLDDELSRYAERDNYTHNIDVQLRIVGKALNVNVGVMARPQRSYLKQDYRGLFVDTVRNVVNVAPTLNARYRFSKTSDIRLTYRGTTGQPSITQMLDITDDSNPMYIVKGNPGLRSTFTNNFGLNYKTYMSRRQTTISLNANYRNTRNSISDMVTYDERTGASTTQPQNINGNWSASATLTFNTAIDTAGVWRISSFSRMNYNHYARYLTLKKGDPQINVTQTYNYSERMSAAFRNKWIEVELEGAVNYDRTRNELQARNNLDTWRFSYGLNIDVDAPWNMRLSTDIREHCRRGYSDNTLNTNELIWNLQLSQSFLKKNALTVMLQCYDILRQQSNFSRSVNANRRSDTEFNAINSYAMLHVVYKMNVFGNRNARRGARRGA